ncbi:exocyst complex component 1-like isoform X2 [Liolophura sinensis]|uniref:exocyst complex component 1-like isoform X2 n=1 Tax=Liolophura sinensis TaxID=3198878 RepID=UPI00315807F6
MMAVKHTLQRDVFLPCDERLIGLAHVTKAGRKKKSSFLCVAVSKEKPVQAQVYQVKKADKGELYKKKASWTLRSLKTVDGRDLEKETAEFDLHFEKIYKWVASSIPDKENFIACLWKLSQRYLIHKPEFVNVPEHLLQEISHVSDQSQAAQHEDEVVEDDYQALSSKEESDLELLMRDCHAAIGNAEAFSEQLSKQLSVLDGANIHSIMGSEDQVLSLMRLLDEGIQEATKIEEKLDAYDSVLQNVKDQMEVIKEKDMLIKIRNENHQSLLEELDKLVKSFDLEDKFVKALIDGDLSTPNGIYDCSVAAEALQKCVQADTHTGYGKMAAVVEQQKKFTNYTNCFARRLARHLNNAFISQGNGLIQSETLNRNPTDFRLSPHHSSHRDLTPYADLMSWLKNADPESFEKLAGVYTQNLSKLYEKDIAEFFECAKQRLLSKPERGKLSAGPTSSKLGGSSSSLARAGEGRGRSSSIQSIDSVSTSYHGSDQDLAQRQLFDQTLEKVLSELEPVCLAEQDFCVRFFHLTETGKDKGKEETVEEEGDIWMPRRTTNMTERTLNAEAGKMMAELFPKLEKELENFINFADKLDGFHSMYMLVRIGYHATTAHDSGSFLRTMFANCLLKTKWIFDRFVETQIQNIQESKVSKKTRCGIISFVHNFEQFANQAENIFRGSNRRSNLEKAYTELVRTIFDQIVRVANEHPKTPREVVMLENFHHMFAVLSQLKISCLDGERKEAKQIYQDNLHAYTTAYLGRPLEKLHTFFEGIQSRVASGVKEEEVGYALAFSKQELRKVIKEYPGKEVKKGLEHLYKKVEKHLCEEENLLQVVWVTMQDEFIKQYKQFDQLINKCYPDSKITLEFTITDILQYFSDIAQSH